MVGYARIAELNREPGGLDAARFFWDTVVGHRTVAFGGNSVREHFNAPDDFASMLESREGPETCNTYNMLRLTERLFRSRPQARYADYYERAVFNHILSTQHPQHGGYVYFTPIRPRHYRVYSKPSETFWCCVGTGMENHGKYGEFIYAHRGSDELFVNLFIASALDWPERRLTIRQETTFPDAPRTRLVVTTPAPQRFTLQVRHPAWVAAQGFRVRINGRAWPTASEPSTYLAIAREWRDGDAVEIDLPMRTTVERLPDGSAYVAFLHGPILLAAKTGDDRLDGLVAGDGRMAHVAPGPYLPLDTAPMLIGGPVDLAGRAQPIAGRPLTFRLAGGVEPAAARGLELMPFFRVHDSRYMMYWRAVQPAEYASVVSRLRHDEEARLALEKRTLDRVTPGEQQPEVEHRVRSEASTTGTTLGRTWRDASGFFGYELRSVRGRGPLALQVTYFGADRRQFDLAVNGRLLAAVSLEGRTPDRFVDVSYPIPADVADAAPDGVLIVTFTAKPGSRAGAVYDIRLLEQR